MESFKNPLLLGILAGLLLYGYYWYMNNTNTKEMNYKYSMYVSQGLMTQQQAERMLGTKEISVAKPILLGVVVWLITNWYFNKSSAKSYMENIVIESEDSGAFEVSIIPLC